MPRPRGDRHRGRRIIPIVEGRSGGTKFRFVGGANPSSTITRPNGVVHWGSCEVGKLNTALPNTGPKGEYEVVDPRDRNLRTPYSSAILDRNLKEREFRENYITPIFAFVSAFAGGGGQTTTAPLSDYAEIGNVIANAYQGVVNAGAGVLGTVPQGAGVPAASGSKGLPEKSGTPPMAPLNTVKFTGFSKPCQK